MALLELKDLHTFFRTKKGIVRAVNGVSYSVDEGKTIGVVGESGSGKSVSAMSILQLLDGNGYIDSGEILFDGRDLTKLSEKDMYKVRGNDISVIFQEPMTSLNPVKRIGWQVEEPLFIHHPEVSKDARKTMAIEMLRSVGLENAEDVYYMYPHELSGGMRQRVMIAAAMIGDPKILIADEPTTALDVTVQAQIVDLLKKLNKERKTSIIFISHDLSLVNQLCQRVIVMQEGKIVESGRTSDIFTRPRDPYTKKLIAAIPRIDLSRDENHE